MPMTRSTAWTAAAALVAVALSAGPLPAQEAVPDAAPAAPCAAPEARQFDFWLGSWEVNANGRVVGRNRITRIHGGCTLLEQYDTAPRPFAGMSVNYWDPDDGRWHQVWVDNSGTRLHLAGGYADGRMVMSGTRFRDGGTLTDRITWTDNRDGTVRQLWEQSTDGGTTWQTAFDGLYTPREDPPGGTRNE
jgi:hypothetical protein